MHIGEIKTSDIANGVGVRTTVFVSGCRRHCPDCFQSQTWDFDFGAECTEETIAMIVESLNPDWVAGLTVLGGEPLEPENQSEVERLLEQVRRRCPGKSVWLYTGYTYEELVGETDAVEANEANPVRTAALNGILSRLDVLVDGPFERDKKDITLRFCGSSNQRLIDMPRTLSAGEVILWEDDPQFAKHSMA